MLENNRQIDGARRCIRPSISSASLLFILVLVATIAPCHAKVFFETPLDEVILQVLCRTEPLSAP
jgi:hypothetical protein